MACGSNSNHVYPLHRLVRPTLRLMPHARCSPLAANATSSHAIGGGLSAASETTNQQQTGIVQQPQRQQPQKTFYHVAEPVHQAAPEQYAAGWPSILGVFLGSAAFALAAVIAAVAVYLRPVVKVRGSFPPLGADAPQHAAKG